MNGKANLTTKVKKILRDYRNEGSLKALLWSIHLLYDQFNNIDNNNDPEACDNAEEILREIGILVPFLIKQADQLSTLAQKLTNIPKQHSLFPPELFPLEIWHKIFNYFDDEDLIGLKLTALTFKLPQIFQQYLNDYIKFTRKITQVDKYNPLMYFIKNKNIKGLKQLFSFDYDTTKYIDSTCLERAADIGSLELMKIFLIEYFCEKTEEVCENAASNGHLECLKYAHENGCPWGETCYNAASNGHLECLQYAHQNGCPWNEDTCSSAAGNGHLECLKYAHENGCPWDATPYAAASSGHLECLKYAHENGCDWDADTCSSASSSGHLACLKYAHENGCPWDEDTCSSAASSGHLACLKYAHENGCPWDEDTCSSASWSASIECLKYAHKNGCPWDEKTCSSAACLKYAHENGCPWDELTCRNAAMNGYLECLKYAHENGCPWDEDTCSRAAMHGHLDCLKYAQENGCPCD